MARKSNRKRKNRKRRQSIVVDTDAFAEDNSSSSEPRLIPRVVGGDCELGNFVHDVSDGTVSPSEDVSSDTPDETDETTTGTDETPEVTGQETESNEEDDDTSTAVVPVDDDNKDGDDDDQQGHTPHHHKFGAGLIGKGIQAIGEALGGGSGRPPAGGYRRYQGGQSTGMGPGWRQTGPHSYVYAGGGGGGGCHGGWQGGGYGGVGGHFQSTTCFEASRDLLKEISGINSNAPMAWEGGGRNGAVTICQDFGRKYVGSNGGCAYIDMSHLEMCIPEVLSAYDYVAYHHAMLRLAAEAQRRANAGRPDEEKIFVLANNSDGDGNSYGSHTNFLLTRRAYDNIFRNKLHYLLFLGSFQASAIILTGQGKVGSENNKPDCDFQFATRPDFIECLVGSQTTHSRPIVNSRNEALSDSDKYARLHVIFFDDNLAHVANFLKIGMMQIILTMIEDECIAPQLILEDPVKTVVRWSHDMTLQATGRTILGHQMTALEMQRAFYNRAKEFVARGRCDGIVPHAQDILDMWGDCLDKLDEMQQAEDPFESDAFLGLVPRLDWALKLWIIRRAMSKKEELTWDSAGVKHLAQMYSSLDPEDGLYLAYKDLTEQLVSEDQIDQALCQPPEHTRAYTRSVLLTLADPALVANIDWDEIKFKINANSPYGQRRTIELDAPHKFNKQEVGDLLAGCDDIHQALDALGVPERDPTPTCQRGGVTHYGSGYTGYGGYSGGAYAGLQGPGSHQTCFPGQEDPNGGLSDDQLAFLGLDEDDEDLVGAVGAPGGISDDELDDDWQIGERVSFWDEQDQELYNGEIRSIDEDPDIIGIECDETNRVHEVEKDNVFASNLWENESGNPDMPDEDMMGFQEDTDSDGDGADADADSSTETP